MKLKISDNLFDDNGWLKLHDVFKSMNDQEIIFTALVADYMSPFSLLDEKRRRQNAALCVDHNYRSEWVKGTNKKIEKAIPYYMAEINPNKVKMIKNALEGYVKQHDAISELIKTANVAGMGKEIGEDDPKEVRAELDKQKAALSAIKDGIQKKVWDAMEYYEKLLGYQYEPPAEVKDDMKVGDGITIDDLDVARL